MVAKCRNAVDGFDNVPGKVAWMAGGEAHAPDAGHLAHSGQQFREAALPFRVAVAVHVLAQQLNLGVAQIGNPPRFIEHRRRSPAALLAARVRHHAVGAEFVASFDDGDIAAIRVLPRRELRLKGLVGLPVVEPGDAVLALPQAA